jgi:hypothetical protein
VPWPGPHRPVHRPPGPHLGPHDLRGRTHVSHDAAARCLRQETGPGDEQESRPGIGNRGQEGRPPPRDASGAAYRTEGNAPPNGTDFGAAIEATAGEPRSSTAAWSSPARSGPNRRITMPYTERERLHSAWAMSAHRDPDSSSAGRRTRHPRPRAHGKECGVRPQNEIRLQS